MPIARRTLSALPRIAALARALMLALGLAAALWPPFAEAQAATASSAPVLVLQVHDAIGPASADYLIRGLKKAADEQASLVIVELDTPGGLDSAMRQIIQAMLASPVPVAVYVSPEGARAASAGTYILYAAHIAAMAPSTTLGAATPVAIGMPGGAAPTGGAASAPTGGGSAAASGAAPAGFDATSAKRTHDAAAFIRALAQQRGRNAEWAERAVREAVSLTAAEALRDKVVDVVAVDQADLLAQIDGRRVKVQGKEIELRTRGLSSARLLPDWRTRLLSVIANPSFALVLMMVGLYGLVFEFMSPGFGVSGVVGAICLLLAMFALQMLPLNYAGLALLLLGLALLAAELLSPSFGVLGAGGIAAFIAGGILLFDSDIPGFGVPLALILALAASSALLVFGAGGMALRARKRRVVSGAEDMIGMSAEVLVFDGTDTWAEINGERWKVRSADALTAGQRVRVAAIQGLTLDVVSERPVAPAPIQGD